jgi:putative phage-type endonuclease
MLFPPSIHLFIENLNMSTTVDRNTPTQSDDSNTPSPERNDDPAVASFWDDCSDNIDALQPAKKKRAVAPNAKLGFSFPFMVNSAVDGQPSIAVRPASVVGGCAPADAVTLDTWMQRLQVTPEQVESISKYSQGSAEWLQSRVGRITASNFGAAMGVNMYMSPRGLLKQLLWGGFVGNVATRWGSDHEDTARLQYLENMNSEIEAQCPTLGDDERLVSIAVEETGLIINPARPWMGNSPDGIITLTYKSGRCEKGLLEIKCPFKKQFYQPNAVPAYYNAQIQGTMGNLNLNWCDFVVWTPTGTQVTRVLFDAEFWDTQLYPRVKDFYFNMYVPLAIKKENGLLPAGYID